MNNLATLLFVFLIMVGAVIGQGYQVEDNHMLPKRFYSWDNVGKREGFNNFDTEDRPVFKRKFYAWHGKRSGNNDPTEQGMGMPKRKQVLHVVRPQDEEKIMSKVEEMYEDMSKDYTIVHEKLKIFENIKSK
uniref:DUF148 domain-containing protein n=1 Tax=Rhabditophanes sp. KR3021 TaxID=114890 RepID=A0AC35UCY1_9BILA